MAQPKYVDWDGLVYYDGKIKDYIATRDSQGIKMGGVIRFSELPDPSFTNLNYIYKITDGFTSNQDFEKPNLIYKENTWVQCANINNTDTYLYIIFNDNEMEGQGGKFDPENYYTKEYIDSTFATKEDINSEVDSIVEDIDTVNQSILDLASAITTTADDIETLKQDLADTEAKLDDVESAVKSIKVPTAVSQLTNDAGYVTSADIPDVSELVTKEEFDVVQQQSAGNNVKIFQLDEEIIDIKQQLENIPDAELYKVDFNSPDFASALDAYNSGKVLVLINAAPDVNSYAIMNYVSTTYITFTKFLTSRRETYGSFNTYYLRPNNTWEVSKEVRLNKVEANVQGNIAGDLRTIQIGNDIYTLPDLTGYATEAFVAEKIAEAELSGGGQDIDLSGYARKEDVPTKVSQLDNDRGYITSIPEEFITETELDARNFATKIELNSKADLTALDAYAKVEDVAEKADKSDLVGLATEEFVTEAISNIELPEADLTDYYTKTQTDAAIKDAVDNIDIPDVNLDGYATTEYVDAEVAKIVVPTKVSELTNDSGYLTEIPSDDSKLDKATYDAEKLDFATKSELSAVENKIPSIDGLATTGYVDEQINNISIPDVSNFVTSEAVNELVSEKANDVLFTKDMRVTTALGKFVIDESVQNMPLAEIITKLLGLIEYTPVDPEGILEGTPSAAVKLIEERIPSYMLANSGEIVPNTYNYRLLSKPEGKLDNQTDSFFYQIVDDENRAVETGYHITTEYLDEGFLTVFIPENVTDFEVKVFDATSGDWSVPDWQLIANTEYQLDGYLAYTADPAYDIYEGIAIRVVIK